MTDCDCQILTHDEGHKFLFVCPKHYGLMLMDPTLDYGLCTNIEANKELHEKYGVPLVIQNAKT